MNQTFTRRAWLTASLGLAAAPTLARAAPRRPLKIITPVPAGGGTDAQARVMAEALAQRLDRPVVIENRTGGQAIIAVRAVASAPPDGDTLLLASNSAMVTNLAVLRAPPYDTLRDFAPVARLFGFDTVILVREDSRFKSLGDLLSEGRRAGSRLSFGAPTSSFHVAFERIRRAAGGVEAAVIPYRGVAPALSDLMGGQIDFTMADSGSVASLADAGRVRVLAVNSAKRSPRLPDAPSLAEAGIDGIEIQAWVGSFFPARAAPAVVAATADAMLAVMKTPQVSEFLRSHDAFAQPAGPQEFRNFLRNEIRITKEIADAAGIRIE